MTRYQPLYICRAVARRNHLFRADGVGISSVCKDAMFSGRGSDDPLLPVCGQCRLVGLTELALALDQFGLEDLAIRVAAHARDSSYETVDAQSDRASA